MVLHPLLGPIGLTHVLICFISSIDPTPILICFVTSIGLASPTPILVCFVSFTNFTNHAKNHLHDLEVIFNDNVVELSNSQFNGPPSAPPCKKQKNERKTFKKYCDDTQKFQTKWEAHMPWVEGLAFKGRFINVVKCRVCSLIGNKKKIIGCKWDTLKKH
jgi:hypothetical protein